MLPFMALCGFGWQICESFRQRLAHTTQQRTHNNQQIQRNDVFLLVWTNRFLPVPVHRTQRFSTQTTFPHTHHLTQNTKGSRSIETTDTDRQQTGIIRQNDITTATVTSIRERCLTTAASTATTALLSLGRSEAISAVLRACHQAERSVCHLGRCQQQQQNESHQQ